MAGFARYGPIFLHCTMFLSAFMAAKIKRKTKKSQAQAPRGGVRTGSGRPRLSLTLEERRVRKNTQCVERNKSCVSVRIQKDTFAKLKTFQSVVHATNISEAMTEAVKMYSKTCATRADSTKILSQLGPEDDDVAERSPLEYEFEWDLQKKLLCRRIQSEAHVPDAVMPLVLGLTQKLWTKNVDLTSIPSARTIRKWTQSFDAMDTVLFARTVQNLKYLHLSMDGSKKRNKRYAMRASFWSDDTQSPQSHVLAAFELHRETAEAFVAEVVESFKRHNIPMTKIKFVMGDLANTNVGSIGGIAALLTTKAAHPVAPAGCDLHIQNRALQNAFAWAYGDYQLGDVHVLALAYQVAETLAAEWSDYLPLLQQYADEGMPDGARAPLFTKCPLPVLTRWWTVILCMIWILDNTVALLKLAQYVHEYYPSALAVRGRWVDIATKLKHPILLAQLRFCARFGTVHYLPEMKWSEQGDANFPVPGYKAPLLPMRLVNRLRALAQLKDDRRNVFADVYTKTDIGHHMRLDAEVVAFLDKFMDTTKTHAEMWLQPPLVLVALADPGHGRDVALALSDAGSGRKPNASTPLTKMIKPDTVSNHELVTDQALFTAVKVFARSGDIAAEDVGVLRQWLRATAHCCPHSNLNVENLFNIMDCVSAVGGPNLSTVVKEERVKGLCNNVLQKRPLEVSPQTGKKRAYHYTTEHLSQVVRSVDTATATYTADVAEKAGAVPKRKPVDHAQGHKDDAKRAAPSRRKPFVPEQAVQEVVVPRAGRYCRD